MQSGSKKDFRQEGVVVLLALIVGLMGLRWGLPSKERLKPLLPEGAAQDSELLRRVAEGRKQLYDAMETRGRLPVDLIEKAVEVPGGWKYPSGRLLNSYRSYFLRSSNPDEQKNLTYLAHMKPRKLDFEPFGPDYGGAYLYPVGAWLGALSLVRAVRITGDLGFYLRDPGRIAGVFLAGRIFSVLSFAACALLILWIGGRGGPGLAGAVFFLLSPVVSLSMHTMNPYGWATLWFLAGCRFLQLYLESGRRRDLLLGGACAGLCLGSSIAYWAAAALAAAPLLRVRRGKDWPDALLGAAEVCAAAGAVFALTNPYFLLRFEKYAEGLSYLMNANSFAPSWDRYRLFVTEFMALNQGPLLMGASLAGLAALPFLGERRLDDRLFSVVFLIGMAHLGGRDLDFAHGRHFLPFFALGSIAAGRLVWRALRRRSLAAAWAVAALIVLHSGSMTAADLWNYRLESSGKGTRAAASRWIEAELPRGASVGLVAPPQYSDTPPFRFDLRDLVFFSAPAQLQGRPLPEYVVLSEVRERGDLTAFLEENYDVAASFGSGSPLPWVCYRGIYTLGNPWVRVYRLKDRA